MESDLEYQNTRTYVRDDLQAMLRGDHADPDDEEQGAAETERWSRSRFEAWRRERVGDRPLRDAPARHGEKDAPALAAPVDLADILEGRALEESGRGHLAAARVLHEQAVEIRRERLGEADPKLPQSLTWLGNLALQEDRLDQAAWLHEHALRVLTKLHGPEHPLLAVPLHNLAVVARHRGDLDQAADLYEQSLALKLQHLGWLHPSVAVTLSNLGNLARSSGDLQSAMCYYARARDIFEQTLGGVNPGLAAALVGLGRVHMQYGVHVSAAFMFERAVRIREAIHVSPTQLAGARLLLATALAPTDPDGARDVLGTAIKEYQRAGESRPECAQAMLALARALA